MKNFKVNRKVKVGSYKLNDIFEGLEESWIVKNILRDKFEYMKKSVEIRIVRCKGYMWVDDIDGSIYICLDYLRKGKKEYLYLDLLHELIHVDQLKRGMNLYDTRYSYIERPTELEAYKYTIEEAKNIGMSLEEILDYLHVEWITKEEAIILAKKLNII
jgi:hypothetical protein